MRGSMALVEGTSSADARVLSYASHEQPNQHAERILGLVDGALEEAGVTKSQIDRIAAGVGPGAFTGIRVGLSLAQGLVLGLGVDGVGVGSLRAVAAGHAAEDKRTRVVLRDARRDEFFLAAYSASGQELVEPYAIPQEGAAELVAEKFSGQNYVVLGTEVASLPCELGDETTEPDARAVGRIALGLDPANSPVSPHYVRGPNVVKPKLPPSPLDGPRQQ